MTETPSAGPGRRGLALATLGYIALTVAWWWPLPARAAASTLAEPFGDPLLNAWVLAWGADRLAHGLSGFWTGLFFYPYPDTLAYSEHLLGISAFTAPLQWLTGHPILTFNVALMASTTLAGVGMFLLARELSGRADVAWLAGVAFACVPYRAPQLYHLQVLVSGWMPIVLYGLHRYVATLRPGALAVAGVAFVLQAFSNGYFLYFTAIPAAVVVFDAVVRRRTFAGRYLRDLGLAAVGILLALAPVALAYVRARREQGLVRSDADVTTYSPPLEAYGQVAERLWVWGDVLPVGRQEFELFPGLLIVALACVAVGVRHRAAAVRLYLAITLLALVLSLGPIPTAFGWQLPVPGPYAWVAAVLPGMDGLRVPARLATVVYLGLSVLGAFGAAVLIEHWRPRARRVAVALLTCVVAIEGYPGPPSLEAFPTADMQVDDEAYAWLRAQPRGPMLELPVGDAHLATRYLFRTLDHGHRIVNGYSGYGSPLQTFLGGPPFTEVASIDESLEMARRLGLRWIVVHPDLYEYPDAGRALGAAMGAATTHVADSRTLGGVMVIELRALAPVAEQAPDPTWHELTPDVWRASASHQPGMLAQAFDGDRATRWATAERQQGQEWVLLRLDAETDVARVRLEIDGRSFGDYPRGLVIESSVDGETWHPLSTGGAITRLAVSLVDEPHTPAIDLTLPPNRTRLLRLRTTGETRVWFWSIHELRVWQRTAR